MVILMALKKKIVFPVTFRNSINNHYSSKYSLLANKISKVGIFKLLLIVWVYSTDLFKQYFKLFAGILRILSFF